MDKFVVLIPAREGSKGIPLKNIKQMDGRPLIYYAMEAAARSKYVDKVYISTESKLIKDIVEEYKGEFLDKIRIHNRCIEAAQDESTTEDVIMDFVKDNMFENLILIQCTNPLIRYSDVDEAIKRFYKFDSIVSTVVQKRFYWKVRSDGTLQELEHDIFKRPRRQEWDGVLAENGSIYIISRKNFLKGHCRLYGRIGTYIMPSFTYFEVDDEEDWILIELLIKQLKKEGFFV